MAAKAADSAFLDGDQHVVGGSQLADQRHVERLGKAHIGNGGGKSLGIQRVGGGHGFAQARAEADDGDRGAFAHDAALADLQNLALIGHLHTAALAARIAHGDRAGIVRGGGGHHEAVG